MTINPLKEADKFADEPDDQKLIVCMRAADFELPAVKGSVEKWCPRCEEQIVMAPATLAFHQTHPNIAVMCLQCMQALLKEKYHDSGENNPLA